MKRMGTLHSALSGWPFQQPSSELRSPTTSRFHPYVQWTQTLLPTGTASTLCHCLHRPARLPVTCPPREGCDLHALPHAFPIPTQQEHGCKLSVWLFFRQLPYPEPEIQLHARVNPPSSAAFQGNSAALPPLPSTFSLSQRLWYDLGL